MAAMETSADVIRVGSSDEVIVGGVVWMVGP